jgi:hypothetical protein
MKKGTPGHLDVTRRDLLTSAVGAATVAGLGFGSREPHQNLKGRQNPIGAVTKPASSRFRSSTTPSLPPSTLSPRNGVTSRICLKVGLRRQPG